MEQYTVTGMSCAACQARVEKAVSGVKGVTSCSVSLLTNSMSVEGTADEADIIAYAKMRNYQKQVHLCPYEHVSSREKVKELVAQIKKLNPEAIDSMYGALTNIKTDYLPCLNTKS